MKYAEIIAAILFVWNLIVFIVYGIDKGKAKRGAHRISEKSLLTLAFLMGGIGAFLGMKVFRHKTKHIKFKIIVPLFLVINIAVIIFVAVLCISRGVDMSLWDKPAVYVKISAQEAHAMMDSGSVLILDVRTEEEFLQAHIKNSILIPDYELSERAELELPDKNAVILVYCRSGRRSELAANELIRLGYRKIYDFGGIIDWPYDTIQEQA